jgi:2-polyprenyl-3-methyl-5-hydroxy-6-metoxy-1,4-benzoquinol methylase
MASSFPCFLCGEKNHRPFFAVREGRFWRCAGCGLIQMHPLPGNLPVGEDYSGFDLETYQEFLAMFRIPQYERDAASILERAKGNRLLDIGCGAGEFLTVAEHSGFRPVGLEPSKTAFEIARKAHPVIRGELGTVGFKEDTFDVVTLWSVLEHVPEPSACLRRIRGLLRQDGILALRVPEARGLLPSLAIWMYRLSLGRMVAPLRVLYQLDWHYKHYYGFDRRTIRRLLESNGFEVVELRLENSYSPPSLHLRMDYLPVPRLARKIVAVGLSAVLVLAKAFHLEDEVVLLARKTS